MTESWFKDTHLCTICDALVEVTRKDEFRNIWHCGVECNLLSVEDATILPTTTKGNEMNGMTETNLPLSDAERYNPNQLVTYKKIAGTFAAPEAPEYITEKVVDIEWALDQARKQSADYYSLKNKIDGLNDKIVEWANPNYSKEEVIRELCEYFGINPTKQVRVTGTIQFEAIVDIPLDEVEDFDAHYLLADDLSLTSYNSNVDINDWSLEDTDVDWD